MGKWKRGGGGGGGGERARGGGGGGVKQRKESRKWCGRGKQTCRALPLASSSPVPQYKKTVRYFTVKVAFGHGVIAGIDALIGAGYKLAGWRKWADIDAICTCSAVRRHAGHLPQMVYFSAKLQCY
jgi:hypothetical protein